MSSVNVSGFVPSAEKTLSTESFQDCVNKWMFECFGEDIPKDTIERNYRFLEEALELVQACGCTKNAAHQLVNYVFNRPIGDKAQEVGGVLVTLAALGSAQSIDIQGAGENELIRIWDNVNQIREKQRNKPLRSPLPTVPLPIKHETDRRLSMLVYKLWSDSVIAESYNKKDWQEFTKLLEEQGVLI